MNPSATIQARPAMPSLFPTAARGGDFACPLPAKSAPPGQTPFAELMRHPEKLAAALQTARRENDAFEAARTFSVLKEAA